MQLECSHTGEKFYKLLSWQLYMAFITYHYNNFKFGNLAD